MREPKLPHPGPQGKRQSMRFAWWNLALPRQPEPDVRELRRLGPRVAVGAAQLRRGGGPAAAPGRSHASIGETILDPLPDVPGAVPEPVRAPARREAADRQRVPGAPAMVGAGGVPFVSPGGPPAVRAARGPLPFGLRREPRRDEPGKCFGLVPA